MTRQLLSVTTFSIDYITRLQIERLLPKARIYDTATSEKA